jgi:nicotinamidase-related amidase
MNELLIGQPVLISIDHQNAGYNPDYGVPMMGGFEARVALAVELVEAARETGIPVVFMQERHARTYADFGRELDGSETVHCVEDEKDTALVDALRPQPDEYLVPKRRCRRRGSRRSP